MNEQNLLTISVYSFSYKTGIPDDFSGNGGGYVFDCRGIHNPGRYERYMDLTGKNPEVIEFFRKNSQIDQFLEHIIAVVDFNIQTYLDRGFTHLMVNFGCTGGQHRSVYCAENFARIVREKYPVEVQVTHQQISKNAL